MSTSIDVVVPVYGKWEVTASCLRHLANQTMEHRVIVVDDASPDDTLVRVREDFPDVDVLEMGKNSGFAAACNRGMEYGTSDIVVLVNNDVDAAPDMLERLVEPFSEDRVGSTVPLLLGLDGRVDAYGITADRTMAGFVRYHGADANSVSSTSPVLLGPYGAVAAYRRTALEEVGFFDEGIFMYGEELDLALRLRNSGWSSRATPNARGIHVGGATAGKDSPKQRYLAGFGRGYILRAYGVTKSRLGPRAVAVELVVCMGRLVKSREVNSFLGRWAGWRAGAMAQRRNRPAYGIDMGIGFLTSLRMRGKDYWQSSSRG